MYFVPSSTTPYYESPFIMGLIFYRQKLMLILKDKTKLHYNSWSPTFTEQFKTRRRTSC